MSTLSALLLAGASLIALPFVQQEADFTRLTTDSVRLAYGPDPDQYGELRLPPGSGPFPVAIVIHGGCFVSRMATAKHTASLADALRRSGFATWNVEYRRIGSPGGGWPETYRDAGRAADHVNRLARDYPLDLTRVIAVGHSAGGVLALWLGGRESLGRSSELHAPNPLQLRAVVALGADGDLPPIADVLTRTCEVPVVAELLGDDAMTRQARASQANPADMPALRVRQVLISGDKDPFETPALRDAYVARARAKGETVDVTTIPGAGHFDIVNAQADAWPVVRDLLVSLIKQTPKGEQLTGDDQNLTEHDGRLFSDRR